MCVEQRYGGSFLVLGVEQRYGSSFLVVGTFRCEKGVRSIRHLSMTYALST